MVVVTVSPKFQIVIPQQVRENLNIRSGQKIQVIAYDNRVVLIPFHPITEARGSLKGINTEIERENDRA